MSQGDHRRLTVRDWVKQAHTALEETTGLSIRDTDLTDDRLTIVLRELSKAKYWHAIERDLSRRTVRVYDLSVKWNAKPNTSDEVVVRLNAPSK